MEVRMKFDARREFLLALLAAVVVAGCQSFPYWVGLKQSVDPDGAAGQSTRGPDERTPASGKPAGQST